MALLLLSVPGIAQRFGMFAEGATEGKRPRIADFIGDKAARYGQDQRSPLLWLAWRVAKGRERLGVHYPSDSAASRKLAAKLWDMCVPADAKARSQLQMPTLHRVLAMASAEWPVLTPPDNNSGAKRTRTASRRAAA